MKNTEKNKKIFIISGLIIVFFMVLDVLGFQGNDLYFIFFAVCFFLTVIFFNNKPFKGKNPEDCY